MFNFYYETKCRKKGKVAAGLKLQMRSCDRNRRHTFQLHANHVCDIYEKARCYTLTTVRLIGGEGGKGGGFKPPGHLMSLLTPWP